MKIFSKHCHAPPHSFAELCCGNRFTFFFLFLFCVFVHTSPGSNSHVQNTKYRIMRTFEEIPRLNDDHQRPVFNMLCSNEQNAWFELKVEFWKAAIRKMPGLSAEVSVFSKMSLYRLLILIWRRELLCRTSNTSMCGRLKWLCQHFNSWLVVGSYQRGILKNYRGDLIASVWPKESEKNIFPEFFTTLIVREMNSKFFESGLFYKK